ncbi:MAG: transporter substrate-binding domain-containing protein, partial [Burkholderiales bacterium]
MKQQHRWSGGLAALFLSIGVAGCALSPSAPSAAARAELASTGSVRVALIDVANFVTQPAANPRTGMGVDIGKGIAARVGAPFQPIVYPNVAGLLADARSGKWDVALLGSDPSRNADFEFTRAFALVQNSYLVPPGSGLMTIGDVDRKGVKVVVADRSAQHNFLKANLKQAEVSSVPSTPEATQAFAASGDAYAANRMSLEGLAAKMPGYRIIPGSFMDVRYSIGVPKGRTAAAAYLDDFVRDMV